MLEHPLNILISSHTIFLPWDMKKTLSGHQHQSVDEVQHGVYNCSINSTGGASCLWDRYFHNY